MKNFLLLTVAAAVLTTVTGCNVHIVNSSGGWSDADLKAVTNVIQTAGIPSGLKGLEVNNHFGIIHITGTDNGTTGWTWKLTVRARTDSAAQQIASGANCKAELDGDHLNLVASLPESKEPHSIQSDFEIRVPKSAVIEAQNRFGRIDIADLAGDVEATDQNGRLEIRNIGGSVHARTSFDTLSVSNTGPATLSNQNGEIRAVGIGGPLDAKTSFDSLVARDIGGPVRLRDQNGRIKIAQVRGDADIETSFDSLSVEGIQGNAILINQNGSVTASGITGSINASTSFAAMKVAGAGSKFVCHNQNGAIRLRATSAALTNIEAKTSFDTLEVHLPASLKPAIQARTTFAEVESDFPVLMKARGAKPFAGIASDMARITLQNQNGRIGVVRD